jgi:hypothetical protein
LKRNKEKKNHLDIDLIAEASETHLKIKTTTKIKSLKHIGFESKPKINSKLSIPNNIKLEN